MQNYVLVTTYQMLSSTISFLNAFIWPKLMIYAREQELKCSSSTDCLKMFLNLNFIVIFRHFCKCLLICIYLSWFQAIQLRLQLRHFRSFLSHGEKKHRLEPNTTLWWHLGLFMGETVRFSADNYLGAYSTSLAQDSGSVDWHLLCTLSKH